MLNSPGMMQFLQAIARSSRRTACLVVILRFALDVLGSGASPTPSEDHVKVRKCEPIRLETCQGLGYNVTGLPNFLGHESQQDAELQLRTFTSLIQYGCSTQLRFFLCAVYTPMCTEKVVEVIGPCRSVCEKVRERCEPVLQQFGFPWPLALDCSKFHPFNDNQHMCMEGATTDETPGSLPDPRLRQPHYLPSAPAPYPFASVVPGRYIAGNCQHLSHPDKFVYSNRTQQCHQLCDADVSFTARDKAVLDIWMAVWSSVGIVSTGLVAATYFVDSQRIRSIERHVVFMTLCYGMCSVAYLVRVIAGRHAISCVAIDIPSARDQPSVLARSGLASTDCTILFVLLYYFSMAGIVWWLVLAFTWLFVAGLRWTVDATVQRLGTYFHIVAWSVPAVQVIVILVHRNIEPNELTGMCHVTANESVAVVGFLLAPMVTFLFVGVTFLGGGLLGYCQTRHRRRGDSVTPTADDETEVMNRDLVAATRLATFCIVCALPLLASTACVLHGYVNMDRTVGGREGWDRTAVDRDGSREPERRTDEDASALKTNHQSVSVLLIQVLASVAVAVFSAFRTICSIEAKRSWLQFLRRRCEPDGAPATGGAARRYAGSNGGRSPAGTAASGRHNATPSVRSYRQSQSIDCQKQRLGLIPHQVQLGDDHLAKRCRTCTKHQLLSRQFQYII